MIKNYTLAEKGSDQVFAVIKDIETDGLTMNYYPNLVNKIKQAIEEEFTYEESVNVIHDEKTLKTIQFPYENNTSLFYMSFSCWNDEDEEEIREVELNQIAIY
jgi:hypothetical protein